ncbi:MAG: formate dehydrogenase accessory protein [Acidobacteria bacterium]|nr:formate dehydrogenase accessory protein [Acidobacteriota bacterium]
MNSRIHAVDVLRVGAGGRTRVADVAAVEEPLEIRLQGSPFIVTMRTPGADRELAAGFLLSERIITGPDDLGAMRHCTDEDAGAEGNVLDVTLVGAARERAEAALAVRRPVTTTSACGVCGRRSIDDLVSGIRRIDADWPMSAAVVASLPGCLRAAQTVFDETGGLHAAGLFDCNGVLVAVAEDVGRHNAVDKVIGSQLLAERCPLGDRALFVSGRTSFEIVQKAAAAGIPIVAAVSAPSSLAIDLARTANVTLLGFVRGETFNIYTGENRILP